MSNKGWSACLKILYQQTESFRLCSTFDTGCVAGTYGLSLVDNTRTNQHRAWKPNCQLSPWHNNDHLCTRPGLCKLDSWKKPLDNARPKNRSDHFPLNIKQLTVPWRYVQQHCTVHSYLHTDQPSFSHATSLAQTIWIAVLVNGCTRNKRFNIIQYNSRLLKISKLTRAATAITGYNIQWYESVNVSLIQMFTTI